ncbi:hypothetical protein NDU88_000414 [Pleurodeles waltl]|uniref:C-type lectin domain-containing protein n=1 Tax=Pleurodeles waltl TaxID=8319 RepID=A0AAV7P1A3_PLEWA|nr:hypothetical protein NDU88_000414 [Pleurodeles waltl]
MADELDAYSELDPNPKDEEKGKEEEEEEEEGAYTELDMGTREEEEEETYTVLHLEAPHRDLSRCPACSRLSLALGIMVLFLLLTVVVQSVLIFQLSKASRMALPPDLPTTPSTINNDSTLAVMEDLYRNMSQTVQTIRKHLCVQSGDGADPTCQICPNSWRQTQEWCYYISNDKKSWNSSVEYCSSRGSRLMTLDGKNEMDEILQKGQASDYYWIGLVYSEADEQLVWLHGAPLEQNSFTVKKRKNESNCASLANNEIYPKACNSQKKWICEKRVFRFNL